MLPPNRSTIIFLKHTEYNPSYLLTIIEPVTIFLQPISDPNTGKLHTCAEDGKNDEHWRHHSSTTQLSPVRPVCATPRVRKPQNGFYLRPPKVSNILAIRENAVSWKP
jgi:hypothetical protein